MNKMKRQSSEREKIITNEATDKGLGWSPKYKNSSYSSVIRKTNSPVKKWADISPKKTYRWSINTWKDTQYYSLLEKCE